MKRVVEKLKCRRGASILLALLFLLVCVLVAMSVLMAAASNAGKIRSNREEQQKYFTLSSALNLVVGELEKAEYRGQYKIITTPKKEPMLGPDGKPIVKKKEDGSEYTQQELDELTDEEKYVMQDYNAYSGEQGPGKFTCGLNQSEASTVLPLRDILDVLFQSEYRLPVPTEPDRWEPEFKFRAISPSPEQTYHLELSVSDLPEDGQGLGKKVRIDATVSPLGNITLRAWLDGEDYIQMEARLIAVIEANAFELKVGGTETGKVVWELERIEKKGAAGP